jgi:peptidoglycan LD-endopeptidase CwlK
MIKKVSLSLFLATLLTPLVLATPSLSEPTSFDAKLIVQNSGNPSASWNKKVDSRSEVAIATLNPQVQPYARELVRRAALAGVQIKVLETGGFRTYQEQDALYCQGRNIQYCHDRGLYKAGDTVTKAKGGYSNHNFGIAFDIGIFDGRKYLVVSPKYDEVGKLGKELGLEWGGDWTTIKDRPHFQLRPKWAANLSERQMLEELRRRTAKKEPFYP